MNKSAEWMEALVQKAIDVREEAKERGQFPKVAEQVVEKQWRQALPPVVVMVLASRFPLELA